MKSVFLKDITRGVTMIAIAAIVGACAAKHPVATKVSANDTPVTTSPETEVACPDGDRDGVCDADDRCPTVNGTTAAFGCPIDPCSGDPLLLLVQFKYDSSEMPSRKTGGVQTMDPVLDEVAAAIAQDSTCRVCIVGHASEEGTVEYNDELSGRRATAVQGYLIGRNLSKSRMPTIGMGEHCQLVPERSLVLNRRVEFHRLQTGESCPVDCTL